MFSRLPPLFLALLAFTSCSLKLNDPVNRKVQLVNTGSGCLGAAGDVLERYAKGELTEGEHDSFYGCLDRALTTFATHADGKQRDYFEPEELGNFLTTYFLKGKKIQPGLLREACVLKQALIGGASDKITREELRRVIALFGVFKHSTKLMLPVMPLRVSSFLERKFTSEQFEDAVSRFVRAVALVGDNIKNEQAPYSFDHFAALVKELQVYLYRDSDGAPDNHWTNTLLKVSEVIRPAKVIFVSPPRDEITTADWPKVYRLAPRYFASWLRTQFYLHSAFETFSVAGLDRIERSFADFQNIFEFVLEQHDDKAISSAEIDDFLSTLAKQGLLPCKPATARTFLEAAFGRLLGGPAELRLAAKDEFKINLESLNRFKDTVRFALEGFHAVAALYREDLAAAEPRGLSRATVEAASTEELLRATKLQNQLSHEAVEAVKASVREVRTIFAGKGLLVRIPKHGEAPPISHFHLAKVHGLRAVNRMLMRAYGAPGANALTEVEFNTFLDDMFPLLLELGLVTPDTRDSISKRLFEASLFLYSSDGNKGLTMPEAIELEALVLSTLSHAPKVHKAVADHCRAPLPKGSARPVAAGCFEASFLANAGKYWGYIPGLAEFFTSQDDVQKKTHFERMAKFLRKGKAETEDFVLADTQAFTLLPYYVELLFSRFDRNGDGLLDNEEAEVAYPVFRPFLAAKAEEKGIKDPKTHKAIFNFLLAYRQLPDDDKVGFVVRRYLLGAKEFKVDRGHVVEIFSKLLSL